MIKLYIVYLFAILFCYISEKSSKIDILSNGRKVYRRENVSFYVVSTLILAVFCGLRTSGNDTGCYRLHYENLSSGIDAFEFLRSGQVAQSPGLLFYSSCMRAIGASTQDFLMVWAIITNSLYLWFIRKYSNNVLFSFFFFLTMGVYGFTMAAMKQTMAVAILMIATDRLLQDKKVGFMFWVFVAMKFHSYAFVYLVLLFLDFKPWTNKTWVLLAGSFFVALSLRSLMGGIMDVTEALGYNYDSAEFSGKGVNVFRVAVVSIPLILSYKLRRSIQSNDNRQLNFFVNASMICSMIMFIGLFGTANYFARLANYFLIFQTISLPYLVAFLPKANKKLITDATVFMFVLYSLYGDSSKGGFGRNYSFMSLWDYLKQLLVRL